MPKKSRKPVPQVGDQWEVRVPFERKKVKIVGSLAFVLIKGKNVRYVWWKRRPKGRYSGMSLLGLMTYGKRLSTEEERNRKIEERLGPLKLK